MQWVIQPISTAHYCVEMQNSWYFLLWKLQSIQLGQPGQSLLASAVSNPVYINSSLLCKDAKLMIFPLWKPQSVQSGQPGQSQLASAVSNPVYFNSLLLCRDAKLAIFSLWKPQSIQSSKPGQWQLASAVSNPVYVNSSLLCDISSWYFLSKNRNQYSQAGHCKLVQ